MAVTSADPTHRLLTVFGSKTLPLKTSFKSIVDNVYRASVKHVDFVNKADEINNEVNLWAEKETRGLIKEILSPGSVTSSTRLILANALYFKGAWKDRFDAKLTKEYDFHLLNGNSVRVPFMRRIVDELISEYDGFKVLRFPYRQGDDKRRLSMHIILPNAIDGLPAVIEKVASNPGILDRPHGHAEVERFRMPKFQISFGFEASDVLNELGLDIPFAGGLTEIVDSPKGSFLQVSNIIHKSFIKVDEVGTEAAAVTCTGMSFALFPSVDFIADHPFLFMIREDITGVVLFVGRVLDPSISS